MKVILIAAIARGGVIGRTSKACEACSGTGIYSRTTPDIDCPACMGNKRVRCNDIPWSYPEDMKHFRDATMGHAVIMGRRTAESIGEHFPLKGRANVVVSSKASPVGREVRDGAWLVRSVEEAIDLVLQLGRTEDAYIIGGAQLYAAALPLADELDLTLIDRDYAGDVRFPWWESFVDVPGDAYRGLPIARTQAVDFECVERSAGAHLDLTFTKWGRR